MKELVIVIIIGLCIAGMVWCLLGWLDNWLRD